MRQRQTDTAVKLALEGIKIAAECGWSLIFLSGQKPVEKDWNTAPGLTTERATAHCRSWSLGLRTGSPSGIVAVVVDTKTTNSTTLNLPKTVTIDAGDGVFQHLFRAPETPIRSSSTKLGTGAEFTGEGGFISFVGRYNPKTRRYSKFAKNLAPTDVEVADLPAEVIGRLRASARTKTRTPFSEPANDALDETEGSTAAVGAADGADGVKTDDNAPQRPPEPDVTTTADNEPNVGTSDSDAATEPSEPPPAPAEPPRKTLLPHHAAMITKSAITPEVAAARGYWSATKKSQLAALGFGRAQQNVPALVCPVHNVQGEIPLNQSRPDEPRSKGGKTVKYETPFGTTMAVDVPPSCRAALQNPKIDLFITEGVKKGDAAASQGLCCIALLGVWNFRGTNGNGGKTVLPDFESIALNDRRVFVAFDSDVMTKPQVAKALERLGGFLESRGAVVQYIYLSPNATGAKVGLDDYFAEGNKVVDLMLLAQAELRRSPKSESAAPPIPYSATPYGIVYEKDTRDGPTEVLLANFTAEIVADVHRDDGAEESRNFDILIKLGSVERTVTVTHDEFFSMTWPTKYLGCQAIVQPGLSIRDHLRAAVQFLSPNAEKRTVFTHTCWRTIDGSPVFLSAGQPIGPVGPGGTVTTEYLGPLARYTLPLPPVGTEAVAAYRSVLKLTEGLAPDHIALALLGAVFRAPLGDANFVVHITGGTGTMKSEMAALHQQFYGAGMNARCLPGNWSSTANALCEAAFLAKDCILVIDDFAPNGGPQDVSSLHQKAERVIRGAGNGVGRGRLNANVTLRAERPPRALILSTGEEIPRGHSIRGRMITIEVSRGDVSTQVLTECQRFAAEGVFARSMSGYIQWLAPRLDDEKRDHRLRARSYGEEIQAERPHARFPENVGQLRIGFECFLHYGRDIGALSEAEEVGLRERQKNSSLRLADIQCGVLATSDVANQFMTAVAALIMARRAHLDAVDGITLSPHVRAALGQPGANESPVGNRLIGWSDGRNAYLDPAITLSEVQRLVHDQGGHIALENRAIERALRDGGYFEAVEESRGRLSVRKVIGGVRRKVWHLRLGDLVPLVPLSGPSGPIAEDSAQTPDAQGDKNSHCGPVGRDRPGDASGPPPSAKSGEYRGTTPPTGPSKPQTADAKQLANGVGHLGQSIHSGASDSNGSRTHTEMEEGIL